MKNSSGTSVPATSAMKTGSAKRASRRPQPRTMDASATAIITSSHAALSQKLFHSKTTCR